MLYALCPPCPILAYPNFYFVFTQKYFSRSVWVELYSLIFCGIRSTRHLPSVAGKSNAHQSLNPKLVSRRYFVANPAVMTVRKIEAEQKRWVTNLHKAEDTSIHPRVHESRSTTPYIKLNATPPVATLFLPWYVNVFLLRSCLNKNSFT